MIFLIHIIIFHFLPLNLMDPIYIKTESILVMAVAVLHNSTTASAALHSTYLVNTSSPTATTNLLLLLFLLPLLSSHRVEIQTANLQLNSLEIIDTDGVSGVLHLHLLLSLGSFEGKEGVMLELGVLCMVVVVALLFLVEREGVDEGLLFPLQVPPHLQTKQERSVL